MTTTSDGNTPPGADSSPFPDTAPVPIPPVPVFPDTAPGAMAPAPVAPELPAPPPLLSHLQPEAQAAAAAGVAAAAEEQPPSGPRRRLPTDTPSGAGRVLLPIALCLVGVVALGAGWIHLEADRAAEAQERLSLAPSAKPPVPSLGSATPTPTTAASTSPSPTTSPSAVTSPSASRSASPTGAPSSSPTAALVVDRSVPVVVLNATNRTGLAAEVAKRLRAKGWTVTSVGNWGGGGIRLTTVFVTGNVDAAATMRRDVKPADGTLPTRTGMPKNRVVLVIGPDFPRLT